MQFVFQVGDSKSKPFLGLNWAEPLLKFASNNFLPLGMLKCKDFVKPLLFLAEGPWFRVVLMVVFGGDDSPDTLMSRRKK